MSNVQTNWILALVDRISGPARAAQGNVDSLGEHVRRVSAIDISAIGNSFQNLAGKIDGLAEPGRAFDAQVKDLSAITGATGAQLDALSESARKTAKEFGGNASEQVNAYKTVLSRLGPDLANTPAAIDGIGNHIQTLSKTMGNDAVGATNALTTAMLQYQVDLSDPMKATAEAGKMMNVMAAGAKYGAAEVPQVASALEQSGVQAKLAGLSFEEANAAIQALATGGKYGSEAGVAFRNVVTKMSAPSSLSKDAVATLDRYGVNIRKIADNSVPWVERLKELGPIQNDINALSTVFGAENAANAQIMLRTADSQKKMTGQVTNTTIATDQAGIVMGSYNEKMARQKAWLEDLKISFFNATQGMLPWMSNGASMIAVMADLKNAGGGLKMMMQGLNKVWGMSPIGRAIIIIGALTAVVAYCYTHFETFRGFVHGVWEALKEFGSVMVDLVIAPLKNLLAGIGGVGKALLLLFEGEFSEAAEVGKQALMDISGVSTIKQAVEGGKRIAGAYRGGFESQITKTPTLSDMVAGGLNRDSALASLERMGIKGGAKYLEGFMSQARKTAAWMDRTYGTDMFSKKLNEKIAQFTGAKGKADSNSVGTDGSNLKESPQEYEALPMLLPGDKPGKGKGKGGGSDNGLSIAGGGSKSVSMRVEIKNIFNVASGYDVRKAAEELAGILDARLRDSAVALL